MKSGFVTRRARRVLIATVVLSGLFASYVDAASYYVTPTVDDDVTDDTSAYDATYATIAEAVAAAQASDTVWLGTGTFKATDEIVVNKAITISGVARPEDTIYDGENLHDGKFRGFKVSVAGAVVKNMTFTRCSFGNIDYMCVYMTADSRIENCIARQNGVHDKGNPWERYCFNLTAGTLSGCVITNNYSQNCPGVKIAGSNVLVENCYIADNSLKRSSYDKNNAGTAFNVTGGSDGTITIRNCTIVNNSADAAPVYLKANVKINFYNNIVYNNLSLDGSVVNNWDTSKAAYTANWHNNCISPIEGLLGNNNTAENPLLLEDSMHLSGSSPCLGAADPGNAPVVDLAGVTRPNPPAMGCLEYVSMGLSAIIHFSNTYVYDPATITCEAVVEGATGALSYKWDFDGDGTVDSTEAKPVISGICYYGAVSVTVSDEGGHTKTAVADTPIAIYNADGITFVTNEPNPNKKPPFGTWETAAETIAEALPYTADGGTVLLSDGLHTEPQESAVIIIAKALTISSVNGRDATFLTTSQNHRYLILNHEGAVFEGITVTNSVFSSWDLGNGILVNYGTIRDCRFTDCTTLSAGVVGTGGSGAKIQRCIFDNNKKYHTWGGNGGNAVMYLGGADSVVEDCLIANNFDGTTDNNRHGGAFECEGENAVFRNNTIVGNECRRGSCLYFKYTPAFFENNIVYGNVTNNAALQDDRTQLGASNDPFVSGNLISSDNFKFNCVYPTETDYADYERILTADPLFRDAESGDFRLTSHSPCVGNGNNGNVSSMTDLFGNRRIKGRNIDLGCYELPYSQATIIRLR